MKCPVCGNLISQPTGHCLNCGADFGENLRQRMSDYFALRNEWDELMATKTALSKQLKKMAGRIVAIEESINADLIRLGSPPIEDKAIPEIPLHDSYTDFARPDTNNDVPSSPVTDAKDQEKKPDLTDRFRRHVFDPEFKIGQKALLFVGIVTMVFGVAFFLKYSFEQGWIGPAGRVALAYLWGIAFLVIGHRMIQRHLPAFGLSLFGGGIAVLYFASYAAFHIYDLLPQTLAFFLMILITILACASAIAYEAQALALLGLIGGFGTPILLSTGQDRDIVLFSYMTLLNLGILSVSFKKRWVLLQYAGFAFSWILFTIWYTGSYYTALKSGNDLSEFLASLIFLNFTYLIYSIIPFAYHFLKREKADLKGFYILIPNSFIGLAYNYILIEKQYSSPWMSIVTIAYAFLFMLFAYRIYRQDASQRQIYVIMLLKASFLLVLTVPFLFSKQWITIFWALQACALLIGARVLAQKKFFVISSLLLCVALVKLFYDLNLVFRYDLDPSYMSIMGSYSYRLVERWLTTVILGGSLYAFVHVTAKEPGELFGKRTRPFFAALFGIFLFGIITLETSAFFHDYLIQARFAAISIVWTFFAMGLMVLGFKKNRDIMRKAALVLLFATVFKVFLFDISRISTPYRIMSFIILGLILILISYLYTKAKNKLLKAPIPKE